MNVTRRALFGLFAGAAALPLIPRKSKAKAVGHLELLDSEGQVKTHLVQTREHAYAGEWKNWHSGQVLNSRWDRLHFVEASETIYPLE